MQHEFFSTISLRSGKRRPRKRRLQSPPYWRCGVDTDTEFPYGFFFSKNLSLAGQYGVHCRDFVCRHCFYSQISGLNFRGEFRDNEFLLGASRAGEHEQIIRPKIRPPIRASKIRFPEFAPNSGSGGSNSLCRHSCPGRTHKIERVWWEALLMGQIPNPVVNGLGKKRCYWAGVLNPLVRAPLNLCFPLYH